MKKSLFLLAAVFLMTVGLFAQSGTGTITGTVTDAQHLAISGAGVTIHSTDTGVDRPLVSNEVGLYVASFLPPGNYEVRVSKDGFSRVIRKDLNLQVGQTMSVDIALPVKSTATEVTVTGDAAIVDTEKTDMSQVVSQISKENLPMAGRNWLQFQFLTPAVTNDGGSGLVSYRGISGLYNSTNVDGTNNNQAFFSESKGRTTVPYVYSLDSIQEYQVAASNYSAEMGQAAGGVVNAVTKSGGNDMHGDLFYFGRFPSLNALDPLLKSRGNYSQPVHQQQQFGGSVGGPIIKDKLFYFLTYDGSRKVVPIFYTSNNTYPQTCNALIPAAICAAANAFAAGNLGGFPRFQNQDIAFGKLDFTPNQANHLNVSFNFDNFRGPNSYTASTAPVANSSLSQNGKAVSHERNWVSNWSTTLSPTTINNFRFQWSRDLEVIAANGTAPSVSITNFTGYGLPNALPRPAFPDEHRLQFSDVLSKVHGNHTFKVGADINFIHELLINLFSGGGVYGYSGTNNFSNWVADAAGINLNDGLTGRHFTSLLQVTDPVTGVGKDDFYNNDYAFFAEDSWKARPNLTFNIGVRYDLSTVPQPTKPNTATPLTTLYSSTINIPKNEFAPRLGMAWEVKKGDVLRVGYGIFYAKTSNSQYYATRVENGVIQQSFNCTPTTCPTLKFPNLIFTPPGGAPIAPFPGALVPQVVPFTPPSATQTTRGQVPDFVNPRVHEGEVTYEHQLPGNMSISGSWLVSRGEHLPVFVDTNVAPSTSTKTYNVLTTGGAVVNTVTVPFYTSRIDPTGPILTAFSDANSWYNAFVLTFRKKYSHGLEFTMNYTLAKAMDSGALQGQVGTFNGGGTNFPVDPKNRKLEYGPSDLDQRQRFTGTVVYSPNFDKYVSNNAAKFIVGGWNLSTIVTVTAGQPLSGLLNGSGAGGVDGGLTGGSNNNSGTALATARPYFESRNMYTGPGVSDVDFRIGRTFTAKERYKLSIIGEAFNIFNFTNIFTVVQTEYNVSGTNLTQNYGTGVAGTAGFFAPTATNNSLVGARQLQLSAKFNF